ncbi:MAG: phenylalanine--tRNA ligase subunit beta, partial [Proteobacteria bacterium]|nr:phenylalanine--tRNA ligase subunit beta [Pseudomonadota bacterium]
PLFFEAKGVVERLLADLGAEAEFRPESGEPFLHPGAACDVFAGRARLGAVGELHPDVAGHFAIDVPCALFELDLGPLLAGTAQPARYRDVSRQPAVRRDVAVLVDRACRAGELIEAIRKTGGSHLVGVELFDRYDGEGIPDGKVSLAFRVVLQRADRTMTDTEISKTTDRVRRMLVERFDGELR